MGSDEAWTNPIDVNFGQIQYSLDPHHLLPSRSDLTRGRLEFQRKLLRSGQPRFLMIQVTEEGVIVDGHHAFRAAAEEGLLIDVTVCRLPAEKKSDSILNLEVREEAR